MFFFLIKHWHFINITINFKAKNANLLTWHKKKFFFVKNRKAANINLDKSRDTCGCSCVLLFALHFKILYFLFSDLHVESEQTCNPPVKEAEYFVLS